MKQLIVAFLTALANACQPDNASQDILAPVQSFVTASYKATCMKNTA